MERLKVKPLAAIEEVNEANEHEQKYNSLYDFNRYQTNYLFNIRDFFNAEHFKQARTVDNS